MKIFFDYKMLDKINYELRIKYIKNMIYGIKINIMKILDESILN